ncbi:MAG: hypothetical protein WC728_02260 [Elusimicrobiota bacterium]
MIARIHALAVLALLLGASICPALERSVPSLGDTRKEEKDPEVAGKQPLGKPLIDRANLIADLITNQGVRGKQVPGIDYFIERLVAELDYGSDAPRKNILDNSLAARRAMRDGHADLRRGVALLMEARDIAVEVNEKLQVVVEENHMGLGRVLEAGAGLGKAVDEMKEEPPEAGSNPDDSPLAALSDLASEIDPLRSKLRSAAAKVDEAGGAFDRAKVRLGEMERRQRRALKLDKAASESLARTRLDTAPRAASASARAGISSEKVIKNAKERFKETIDEAFRVREAMKDLMATESGLGKSVEDVADANRKTQEAKAKANSTTPKVIESAMMLKSGYKPAYERAGSQKKAVVDQARAEIQKAQGFLRELEGPFEAAKQADAKSYASARDGDEKLEDLNHRRLGERSKDGLTPELVDRRSRVSRSSRTAPGTKRQPPDEDGDPGEGDGYGTE